MERHCNFIIGMFEDFKKSLPNPSAKVFMMNHAIRTGMAREFEASGKSLIEVKA